MPCPDEGPVVERIRAALRAHLGVVAGQLDVANGPSFGEWRYLERRPAATAFLRERRRYEERFPARSSAKGANAAEPPHRPR